MSRKSKKNAMSLKDFYETTPGAATVYSLPSKPGESARCAPCPPSLLAALVCMTHSNLRRTYIDALFVIA